MTIPLYKLPCYFAGDDWDFEESMAELGCTVHAYDPYVKSPNTTRENLHFYEIGKEVLTCQMYTFIKKKTAFFSGTPNFFGPSYFEVALEGSAVQSPNGGH